MAKYNVHDLARELRKSEEEIINICVDKGMSGVTRATMLSDKLAEEIRALFPKPEPAAKPAQEPQAAAKKKFHLVYHPEHSSAKTGQAKKRPETRRPVRQGELPDASVAEAVKAAVTGTRGKSLAKPGEARQRLVRPGEAKPEQAPVKPVSPQSEEIRAAAESQIAKTEAEIAIEKGKAAAAAAEAKARETAEKLEAAKRAAEEEAARKEAARKEEIARAEREAKEAEERAIAEREAAEKAREASENTPVPEVHEEPEAVKPSEETEVPEKTETVQAPKVPADERPVRRDPNVTGRRDTAGAPRRDGRDGRDSRAPRDGRDARPDAGRVRRDGQTTQRSYNTDRPSYGNRTDGVRRDVTGRDGQRPYAAGQGRDGARPYAGTRPGAPGQGFRKDGPFQKDGQAGRPQAPGRGGKSDSGSAGMTKTEARGGKGLNKKERELREKERQSVEKNGRFTENTKNMSKTAKNPNRKGAFIQPEPVKEPVDDGVKTIILPESLTVTELAEKMKITPAALVKALFMKGTMLTINAEITFDQAEEIALEYNIICEKEVKVDVIEELLKEEDDPEETKVTRPPVVCVMGHVDHGKTSLLDAIRSTNVIAKEAGGITQHIGAYTVKCNGRDITFLDTPGHEAFTAMRMRGAQATDIAVLVVAADDGVMPQTVEAINHAKAAGVDIIVAINKIDKPAANIDRVKQELSEHELVPEDWGGTTIFVPVSAKTHEGIDSLLEMILLDADIQDLKSNPDRAARGLVIEAQLDKGRGPVATVLVQKGTLHVGDNIAVGSCYGRVRAMIDDKGRRIKEATPSIPVEILGLNDVPNAGDVFVCTENEKDARSFAETFIKENREKLLDETRKKLTLDSLNSQIQEGKLKELNIIVKADVQGSVEAVKTSLLKLSNDEIVVKVIHSGVGAINESDVSLASASNAIIIGFNTKADAMAKQMADSEKVEIRLYRVIYQAIEDIEAAMKGMLDPVFEEKVTGHAVVRQTFKASGVGTIAGSYVMDGTIQRGCKVRISRAGEQIFEGNLASLKRFKDDVKEVREGYECGLVFEKFNDIQIDDEVEAYTMVEVPR